MSVDGLPGKFLHGGRQQTQSPDDQEIDQQENSQPGQEGGQDADSQQQAVVGSHRLVGPDNGDGQAQGAADIAGFVAMSGVAGEA